MELTFNAVAALLPEDLRGSLEVHKTIDSTNLRCKALAAQGAAAGTAVAADEQTAGRGRLGRRFDTQAGKGVYLSVLLRPGCPGEALRHLTAMAAVAVREAIAETCGLQTDIKWVNDLLCQGRKLCGILVELGFDAAGLAESAVVGVGVNCDHAAEDFPPELRDLAGSVAMFTGKAVDRAALCAALIRRLAALQEDLFDKKADYLARYAAHCVTIGARVRVLGAEERPAICTGIDENAALKVVYDDGSEGLIAAGEVSVRGLYGYAE